jgi:DnaK suppressor protein
MLLSRVKPRSDRAGAAEAKRSCSSTNKRPGSMANTAEQPRERFTNFTPYEMKKGEDYMSADMLQHFKNLLLQWKQELMEEVDRTMHHMQEDAANYADPSDRATQEEEFSLELRTRDRERKLIKKIDQTIDRIDKDDYGFCDQCGVEIGIRRLEARPTATLCIDCKTLAEIRE